MRPRFALRRVDLRDGVVAESSSITSAFRAARLPTFRAAVFFLPAFRSVALTPGAAVSTGTSLRGRAFFFFLAGARRRALSIISSALNRCALVAIAEHLIQTTRADVNDVHAASWRGKARLPRAASCRTRSALVSTSGPVRQLSANSQRRIGRAPAAQGARARSSRWPRAGTFGFGFGCVLLLVAGSARAETPRPSRLARECTVDEVRRALAIGSSLVPGVLVHGAGHWVLCDPKTARKLLVLEGAGAGSLLVSLGGLAASGASRYVVAPLAVGALGGLGLFTTTWLADIYGVVAPDGGFGAREPTTPKLTLQSGLRAVYDPLFQTRWLLSQSFALDAGHFWISPRLDAAPDGVHRRYALLVGRRVLGATLDSQRPARWSVDVKLGVRDFRESEEGFGTSSAEVAFAGRMDLGELGRTLEGAFGFAEFGYSREWHRFDGAPGYDWESLLGRWGFGVYLGHGPVRGEASLAYDHRRDTVAGGLHLPGIAAGYAGFLEHRTELYFGRHFGAAVEVFYGSAFVGSGYFLMRLPRGGW